MNTLAEKLKVIAEGQYLDVKDTLLQAASALERAELSHYAIEPRDMLRSLQEANISIGYACQWLRKYILQGMADPISQASVKVDHLDQSNDKHEERMRKLEELEVTIRCAKAFEPSIMLVYVDYNAAPRVQQRINTLMDELFPKVEEPEEQS